MNTYLKKIKNENIFLVIFFIYLISIKIYFLVLNPASLESYITAVNTHIFFNAKSFFLIPQSFVDWNHPGTPLYYITSIIFFFYKDFLIKDIFEFLYILHIFFFFLLIVSIYKFINYFKNIIQIEYIFLFLILICSFDTFILSLEVVDYTSLKLPIALMIIIHFHQFVEKNNIKNLGLIVFYISLANSIILSFLSITIAISFSILLTIILKKKYNLIKYFFLFNVSFFSILNFPILGRIPKIIFNVIFLREDTRFEIANSYELFQKFFFYTIENYYYFFIPIFAIFLKSLQGIYKGKYLYIKNTNNLIYLITSGLIFLFFIYTILSGSNDDFGERVHRLRGVGLRNIYISSIFIFFLFIVFKKLFSKFELKSIIILSIISLIIVNFNYIKTRNNSLIELDLKEDILQAKINLIFKDSRTLAVYSDNGYGFKNFNIIARANSILAGEKFNNEMFLTYPNLRFFRLNDIIFKLENKKFTINKYVREIDDLIKIFFTGKARLILSPNSLNLTTTWIGSASRPDDIFIKKRQSDKINGIVLNKNSLIKNNFINLKNYIYKNTEFKKFKEIKVREDVWLIFY